MSAPTAARHRASSGSGSGNNNSGGGGSGAALPAQRVAAGSDKAVTPTVKTRLPKAVVLSGYVVRATTPLMVGVYPLVCTSVLQLLRCVRVDGSFDDPSSRWVVAAQPYLTCWGSQHFLPAVLASVTAVVYVLAFPVTTLAYLCAKKRSWQVPGKRVAGAVTKWIFDSCLWTRVCVFVWLSLQTVRRIVSGHASAFTTVQCVSHVGLAVQHAFGPRVVLSLPMSNASVL